MSRKVTRVMIDGKVSLRREGGISIKMYAPSGSNEITSIHFLTEDNEPLAIIPTKDREFHFLTDNDYAGMKQSTPAVKSIDKHGDAGVIIKDGDALYVGGLMPNTLYSCSFTSDKGYCVLVDGVANEVGSIRITGSTGKPQSGDVVKMY